MRVGQDGTVAEVSLCIPTFQNPEGCYLSVFSALQQLEKSNLTWEIVIAADGGTATKWEQAHPNIRVLRYGGGNRLGSPQVTRDAGIRACQYKNVLCIDSHVVISDIPLWVELHEKLEAGNTFPSMAGGGSEMWKLYGSVFDWDASFWYKHVLYQPQSPKPYRIVETSHSGFMVDRDFYISSGGYTNLQVGYGGEETLWGLKTWMLGKTNWLLPQIWHAHFQPVGRNEGAEVTQNYKRNFCVAAFVLGGEKYLEKTERHYNMKLTLTPDIQNERQRICNGPYRGDLDALRIYLEKQGIE